MLSRRRFLELTAIAAAAPLAGCRVRTHRPNVLFIALDDLNDWVGYLGGHPDARTPNLDAFAGRGVAFTNAHCTAPFCGGSRTAVLTGLAPHTTGVYQNQQHFRPVAPDCVTLTQLFAQHGYRVVLAGKIYHIDDERSTAETMTYEDRGAWERRSAAGAAYASPIEWQWGPLDAADDDMIDGQLVSQAVEFLGGSHAEPFFFGLGLWATHLPWLAPLRYFRDFPPDEVRLPVTRRGDSRDLPQRAQWLGMGEAYHSAIVRSGQWPYAVSAYLACMSFMDTLLGRVFDALERGPHRDNTLVVLWSDHGFMHGQKRHWAKFVLWEEATRVPLVVYDSRSRANGLRCRQPASLLHLYPTLADLCELPLAGPVDGLSLRPLLDDVEAPWSRPALISQNAASHAVRSRHWRYIRYGDGSEELYSHRRDPHEWRNLARRKDLVKVKKRLGRWIPSRPAPMAPRWKRPIASD